VVGEASLGSEDTPRGDDAVSSRGRRAGLFVLRHRVCARVALRASPPPDGRAGAWCRLLVRFSRRVVQLTRRSP
jgi:hypothetical protein